MVIDIWDGDSLMHYGSVKVLLFKHMRQGHPSNVQALEFEVINPEQGHYVGGLQMVITNEGRKLSSEATNEINSISFIDMPLNSTVPNPAEKLSSPDRRNKTHKKKVLSKPITDCADTQGPNNLA